MYHATPYGRNVNEGLIEYPPSPYRIVRALIDTWKRKLKNEEEDAIIELLGKLSNPPSFYLPNISQGTVVSYLDSNTRKPSPQLIYDSFVSINPDEKILIFWDNMDLDSSQVDILARLLDDINYLGRSESWVKMKIEFNDSLKPNCILQPSSNGATTVKVALPVPMKDYVGTDGNSKYDWFNSLTYDSTLLLEKHIDTPPALKYAYYEMPKNILNVRPKYTFINRHVNNTYGVLYALNSKVLPLITDSILIGERFHKKILGIYKHNFDSISPTLSGKCSDGTIMKGHRHIFISPMDIDNDGRIDHILVKSTIQLIDDEIYSLDLMRSLWQDNGKPDIRLIPVEWIKGNDSVQIQKSRIFESVTPFVLNKHYRKGRGDYSDWIKKEVIEELSYIGLPEPENIEMIKNTSGEHRFIWLDFYRSRNGDSPRMGYGFKLTFKDKINLPFNIGYASHFGLGLFMPVGDGND